MATHIACHTNECLPNRFPPPRPMSRDHGMLSDYAQNHVMRQSVPMVTTSVDGGTAFPPENDSDIPDIEPLPLHQRLTLRSQDQPTSFTLDPDLCVTPEKPSVSKRSDNGKSDSSKELHSPESNRYLKSSRVRFDQKVTVKHVTPETSEDHIIDIDRTDVVGQELSFSQVLDDEDAESNHSIDINHEADPEHPGGLPEHIEAESQSDVEKSISSSDSSVEYQRVIPRKVARRHQFSMESPETEVIDVEPRPMALMKAGMLSGGTAEHMLARPEFNSTLFMSKEVQQEANRELDLPAAVAAKLKLSDKTRARVDEKTYARLNDNDKQQFLGLVSIDVREDDLVDAVAVEMSAKARPAHKSRQSRPEDQISHPPDLLEFFTPDLQRELPSFTVPGLPTPSGTETAADPLSAFDTFQHIRAWEDW